MNSARASEMRMRQPPLKCRVGRSNISTVKPRPEMQTVRNDFAAHETAEADRQQGSRKPDKIFRALDSADASPRARSSEYTKSSCLPAACHKHQR
jgi:hypothetical protein